MENSIKNSFNVFCNAVAGTVSTNRIIEAFGSIIKSLGMSKETKSLLCTLASTTPAEPPVKPGGKGMTICEMYPGLTSQEVDYLMAQYRGDMKRGKNE